jgi:predicted amidohydrolase YtcJ
VRAYTSGAAYAAGLERVSGALTPGRWADFVVCTEDVLNGPPEAILSAKVVQTVVGGQVVFSV